MRCMQLSLTGNGLRIHFFQARLIGLAGNIAETHSVRMLIGLITYDQSLLYLPLGMIVVALISGLHPNKELAAKWERWIQGFLLFVWVSVLVILVLLDWGILKPFK